MQTFWFLMGLAPWLVMFAAVVYVIACNIRRECRAAACYADQAVRARHYRDLGSDLLCEVAGFHPDPSAFAAVDSVARQLKDTGQLDVFEAVKDFRASLPRVRREWGQYEEKATDEPAEGTPRPARSLADL
jgi:hypothetical protein